ncbi:MAG: F0F1 ATP synthase subunit gamma [candidate division Zixibacteria bacterium]|nr:F0F1 ATP synthase subunit gamma [candidate division Zixibacteria bacterium]
METLESLQRHIESTEDLQSVVKTMKAIAAVNIRQYEQAADALNEYNNSVSMAFQILLTRKPGFMDSLKTREAGGIAVVIYGSEMGMVGQFNDEVVEYALENIADFRDEDIFMMTSGFKATSLVQSRGYSIDSIVRQPGSVEGIGPAVEEMLLEYLPWREGSPNSTLLIFYNSRVGGASYKPQSRKLLPLDLGWLKALREKEWDSRAIPRFPGEWSGYFRYLFKQYLYVSLYRAFAESLASENASRLASMQAAEKNIEEEMHELSMRFNQRRQSSVTAELLDIASGFEALRNEDDQNDEKE